MSAGYVYVLVNSSMLGLVKVGKTTRPVGQRAAELSGVTGVATPFVVAFEQYFLDCDSAEQFVHAELERRGAREAANREFFRAEPNEVIRVIMQAPGAANPADNQKSGEPISDNPNSLLSYGTDTEFDFTPQPWADLLQSADEHYYGYGDTIENYAEALRLYTDAARVGSLVAYERIGNIYLYGNGVREDKRKALEFYYEGAKRGNYFCYAAMANVYENENLENAKKAWAHMFRLREQRCRDDLESKDEFIDACARYVIFFCRYVGHDFLEKLRPMGNVTRRGVIERLSLHVDWCKGRDSPTLETNYRRALKWARANLSEGIEEEAAAQAPRKRGVFDLIRNIMSQDT